MLQKNDLEDNVPRFLRERMPQARIDVVVDVGANVGWSAYQFLQQYPECTLHLIEPVSSLFKQIYTNLGRFPDLKPFPRTTCYQLAFGATRGKALITAIPDVTVNRIIDAPDPTRPSEEVNLTTGDAFCSARDIKEISFLKIDAEGYDLNVVLGFWHMLLEQRIDFVQVEAGWSAEHGRGHVPFDTLRALLGGFGYRVLRICNQASGRIPVLTWSDVVFISAPAAERYAFEQ